MRRLLGSLALATVVLLPVSACNNSDKGGDSAGTQTIEIPGQGVSFELPDDWEALTSEKVSQAGEDTGAFDELAGRMGIEPAQMTEMLKSIDIFVGAPEAENGVMSNVNALHFAVADLPAKELFETQYKSLGATEIGSTDVSTAVGDGYRVSYTLEVKGQTMSGVALALDHGSVILDITVTTNSAATSNGLADQIVASLAETS
jgi:hypothetical protein